MSCGHIFVGDRWIPAFPYDRASCAENDIDDASREAVWKLTKTSPDTAEGRKLFSGIYAETEALRDLLTSQGVDDWIAVNPAIVRGLAYYTGPVFEGALTFDVVDESGVKRPFGSVFGGGRYDDLIERFTGQKVPATGASIGVGRLLSALRTLGRLDGESNLAKVIVTRLDKALTGDYLRLVADLRAAGIN
ncbi:MAG: ATP phosphoribosyltransferase regulatory subunit, partial [Planctomycetes bacterium]|nr:ATP phosphoribosyltransferase regulatory subunit [Planctomycetota bacterium]